MAMYGGKCSRCKGLFVFAEPRGEFVCDECAKAGAVLSTHYQCVTCLKVCRIGKEGAVTRCKACRQKLKVKRNTTKRELLYEVAAKRHKLRLGL
jgi:DNA-directed RNA polymerase subunit RPC12/RpoP